MNTRQCLFCKSVRSLSKEHIIPQWLLEELGLDDQQVGMIHFSTFGPQKSQRMHSFKTLVNAQVCQECNSGWMSELEVSVKDIITRLMRLEDMKDTIGNLAQNSEAVARWSFKTAIVLNYPTNYRDIVPEDHFLSIYNSKIPEGIYINLAFTDNVQTVLEWRQSQNAILFGSEKTLSCPPKDSYKITMKFEHLLLRVSYISLPDFVQGYRGEESIALWPDFGRYEDIRFYENIDEFDCGNYFIQV